MSRPFTASAPIGLTILALLLAAAPDTRAEKPSWLERFNAKRYASDEYWNEAWVTSANRLAQGPALEEAGRRCETGATERLGETLVARAHARTPALPVLRTSDPDTNADLRELAAAARAQQSGPREAQFLARALRDEASACVTEVLGEVHRAVWWNRKLNRVERERHDPPVQVDGVWTGPLQHQFNLIARFQGPARLQVQAWEAFLAPWHGLEPEVARFAELLKEARLALADARQRAAAEPPAAPLAAPTPVRHCAQCPEMVAIPAGSWLVGSPLAELARFADTPPVRPITLPGFWIARTEVTRAQWAAVMGSHPGTAPDCTEQCPVETVSWDDVQVFIARLNERTGQRFRLPSRSEWEVAARAGTTTAYAFGPTLSAQQANHGDVPKLRLREVGQYPPNAWGLHDMHGNVAEWLQDCSGPWLLRPVDGTAYELGDCQARGIVGGSWRVGAISAISSGSLATEANERYLGYGLRLARSLD